MRRHPTSAAHCGACGNACTAAQVCSAGKCANNCTTGQTACSGACVDTQTDNANCGACGTACTGGSACAAGKCDCSSGQTLCSGACVNTQSDNANCGACGTACSGGKACAAGQCACPSGQTTCSGQCTNTQTDPAHCGACGTACTTGQVCSAGTCTANCTGGTTKCGNSCVNLQTDTANCGACAKACATGQSCSSGTCACPSGGSLCSGACVNTQTSNSHCGACGNACTGGKTCAAGTCSCPSGQTACGATCVNMQTDNANCGACAKVCPSGSTCQTGACVCGSGQTLCGNACVSTQTDNSNCGTCGKVCTGGAVCTAGNCVKTPLCGDAVIDTGEHCDDGNKSNLDGCDSTCKYEMFTRLYDADIVKGTAPSFCAYTANRLGQALSTTAVNQLNTALQDGIDDAGTNIMVQALGLDDLKGDNDPALELGIVTGTLDPAKGAWPGNGAASLDWWFKLDAAQLDANNLPTGKLTGGVLANTVLTAGPSPVNLTLMLSGSPAVLQMRDAKIRAATSGTDSVSAPPPGALASGLLVFPEVIANGSGQGLCGAITVDSLSKIPIPEALTTGAGACKSCSGSKVYTYCGQNQPVGATCNSLLDALVGGCKVDFIVSCAVTVITSTQPDVPKSGGSLTPLSVSGTYNKVPSAQSSGNMDAYSSFLAFRARRAHATGKQ